jgi:hypothetical protein
MKQVLFILLVFISFQGVAQESVKIKGIGLEIMTKDLGKMTWYEATEMCKDFGDGWRLPTVEEFKKIYKYKDFIGGFQESFYSFYWGSTEYDDVVAWDFDFTDGVAYIDAKDASFYVRAVRDLE